MGLKSRHTGAGNALVTAWACKPRRQATTRDILGLERLKHLGFRWETPVSTTEYRFQVTAHAREREHDQVAHQTYIYGVIRNPHR